MKIKFSLDPGAYAPEKAHAADAGFDLRMPNKCTRAVLLSNDSVTIDTGIHVEIPEGYVGMLKSKSGLNVKYGITCEGVIDAGYTGSIVAKLYRSDWKGNACEFYPGDKITQLVIMPIPEVELEQVEAIDSNTERGANGFGSTGR